MKFPYKQILLKLCPNCWYLFRYHKAEKLMNGNDAERKRFFGEFVDHGKNEKKCVQFGVRGKKYSPHWISVDLYDTSPLIDLNYDIHALKFKSNTIDRIACLAILEHVEDPVKAVGEMRRVLKPGGEIWVEIPFNQPYHPSPNDYWRVTPEGIKILMKDFDCIQTGHFKINNSSIYNGIFYWGKKG